ncbi:MAG: rhamnulokinase [Planctomycetota bacterium]|jgi:rhamnulokinase
MSDARVIAIDLGASSGRVCGVRFDDGRAAIDRVHRFANRPVLRTSAGGERWCWDFDAIMDGVHDGLRVVAADGPVESIAVDSWAVDYGLLDEDDRLVAAPTAYRDERHRAAFDRLRNMLGPSAIYARTGIQFQPFNTLYQLATDAVDPARPFDRARRMLMIPDLVANRLCGSRHGERTNAGSTQCFDTVANRWCADLLEAADVPVHLMPEVVAGESAAPLGTLDPALASSVGLPASTAVRATASHDTAAAVAAAPLDSADDAFVSSGTWSLVGFELDEPVRTEAALAANLTNEPGVFGTTRLLRNVSGLWLLQECRRAWAEGGHERDWTELETMAASATPFRTVIDPDAECLATPGDMPERIVAEAARLGEPVPDDDAALVRCILDSVALRTVSALRCAAQVAGRRPTRLVVVGGGAANMLLNRLLAAISGLPVVCGSVEATTLGNALVQRAAALGLERGADLRRLLPPPTATADPDDLPEVRAMAEDALDHAQPRSEPTR